MTLPVWPSELSEPTGDGWKIRPGDSRRRAPGDQGPPRVRRGVSRSVTAIRGVFIFDVHETARFERFLYEETVEGALPFLMPDFKRSGEYLTMADRTVLTDRLGNPLVATVTKLCMFGEQLPAFDPLGAEWQVSVDISVMP